MKILVLMHESLIPPPVEDEEKVDWQTVPWVSEYDVLTTLKSLGHEAYPVGVHSDLNVIRKHIQEEKPALVFNMLEEFDGEAIFDQNVVSYLELLRIPYTGCNPRGLMLARNKALAKKVLTYHRVKTPKFASFPRNRRLRTPANPSFPLIVKALNEEASAGLSQASVVHSVERLKERVEYMHSLGLDALAEKFVEGREFFVGVLGNYRLEIFEPRELIFSKSESPERQFYSQRAKFDIKYRERHGIDTKSYNEDPELVQKLKEAARKTYKALYLNGYARIDLRVSTEGEVFVIEANPNPDLSENEDFALSALESGYEYPELLEKILRLGRSWNPTQN